MTLTEFLLARIAESAPPVQYPTTPGWSAAGAVAASAGTHDGGGVLDISIPVAKALAAMYAEHADYDEAWRA